MERPATDTLGLPVEVLAEIFCLASQQDWGDDPDFFSLQRQRSLGDWGDEPIVIGHVCRHWNYVAMSTPQLWSSIALTLTAKNAKFKTKLAKLALTNSAALPLFITFTAQGLDKHANACLNLLWDQSHRWRAISLEFPWGNRPSCLQNPSLQILEELEIWIEMMMTMPIPGCSWTRPTFAKLRPICFQRIFSSHGTNYFL